MCRVNIGHLRVTRVNHRLNIGQFRLILILFLQAGIGARARSLLLFCPKQYKINQFRYSMGQPILVVSNVNIADLY